MMSTLSTIKVLTTEIKGKRNKMNSNWKKKGKFSHCLQMARYYTKFSDINAQKTTIANQ